MSLGPRRGSLGFQFGVDIVNDALHALCSRFHDSRDLSTSKGMPVFSEIGTLADILYGIKMFS